MEHKVFNSKAKRKHHQEVDSDSFTTAREANFLFIQEYLAYISFHKHYTCLIQVIFFILRRSTVNRIFTPERHHQRFVQQRFRRCLLRSSCFGTGHRRQTRVVLCWKPFHAPPCIRGGRGRGGLWQHVGRVHDMRRGWRWWGHADRGWGRWWHGRRHARMDTHHRHHAGRGARGRWPLF